MQSTPPTPPSPPIAARNARAGETVETLDAVETLEDSEREGAESIVDELLDGVLPEGLEWRQIVRAYPLPCLAVAALGGFFIGRNHGSALLGALSTLAAAEVAKNVGSLLGQEV
jgi:hypothetical protein